MNSRESIIDFIEKSDQFTHIKKHCSNLLIKTTFELELKKISALQNKNNVNCLIFYYKKQKVKDLFFYELRKIVVALIDMHINLALFMPLIFRLFDL